MTTGTKTKTRMGILLVATLAVASCGTVRDSRLNPFNWFGRAQSQPVAANASATNPLLPQRSPTASLFRRSQPDAYAGQPVAQLREMALERRPGGAILRVEGVADRVGPFDVRLTPDESADPTVLSFTLNALQRPGPRNAGPNARAVTAAVWLSDNDLAGVRSVSVRGRDNALVSRR
ncbi:hypothetical protein [Roseivivax isoporae]|uniref:Lipoprotein n=1 Tax=Roseivivax isoporae LMG 25204 TaxID=1449351 RepID=X7F5H0_9RHOB|nr:hypothetical protein [Roseivivax isoporae]ETX27329.1 hypothetical protein RISW2_14630 [Roseivivax isoporae LMG 25204]